MTQKAFGFGQEAGDPQNNYSPEQSRIHGKNWVQPSDSFLKQINLCGKAMIIKVYFYTKKKKFYPRRSSLKEKLKIKTQSQQIATQ